MHRVSDCAGSGDGSPITPPSVWPSASHNSVGTPEDLISQLDGWPACAPVNASPAPLPVRTHDSGSGRLAGSSPYGSFIHNSSPVFSGALRDHLKLEMSPEKTLITHAGTEHARFLGYDIGV